MPMTYIEIWAPTLLLHILLQHTLYFDGGCVLWG